jgi:hypothetical protein
MGLVDFLAKAKKKRNIIAYVISVLIVYPLGFIGVGIVLLAFLWRF